MKKNNNNHKENTNRHDIDIEKTDRLDTLDIHRRFYTGEEESNTHKNNNHKKDNSSKKTEEKTNIKKNRVKDKPRNKINFTSVIIFLTTLLFLATIILVITTIANNKKLNDKIKDLTNITETLDENGTEDETEPTEETKNTEPTFEGSGETKSGRLIQALNLRSGPGYNYSVIGVIPEGTEVSGEIVNGWLKIEYNGQVGYIGPKFVE